jgi:hypothetical protein
VGVGSRFQVLRAPTHFQWYRDCRVPFSCFARPDSFSAVPGASAPVFLICAPGPISAVPRALAPIFRFCAPGLVFAGTKGVDSPFHVLSVGTRFRLPFSCFARPVSVSAVPRVSDPVFLICAPGLIFGVNEGIGSRFHVLRARTRFQRYRGRRLPFSSFARPDTFSAVPWASSHVLKFCALELVFGGIEGVESRFHVLRARTHWRRYRGRRVSFSCFARPNSFLTVPRALGPVFKFCAPGLFFQLYRGCPFPF